MKRLFEVGERYFNELINTGMVQPIEIPYEGIITGCRLHDLVLDMIISLSKEENFVNILDCNNQYSSSQSNARRSFSAATSRLVMMPSLSSFQVLRVLALERCYSMEDRPYQLEDLGRLLQLRYLGLPDMPLTELPEKIGNLRFLQTPNLGDTKQLPCSVGLLRQLKCLRIVSDDARVSDWIGNLTSLEELWLDNLPMKFVKELGKLTELRILFAGKPSEMLCNDIMKSTGNMEKLQSLHVDKFWDFTKWVFCEGYVPPRHLHRVTFVQMLPSLPVWIDSSRLPYLSHLYLKLQRIEARDLEILGRFPELVALEFHTHHRNAMFLDIVGGGAFPKLRYFSTCSQLRFLQGAMPNLEYVDYILFPDSRKNKPAGRSWEQDIASMENLPCLQEVRAHHASSIEEIRARAVFWHAIKIHPNSSRLELRSTRNHKRRGLH